MNTPVPALPDALRAIVEALLIGFLIGAQREASHGDRHPGVRDFVLIALTGGICGLLQEPWLTVAALVSVTALLVVFYFHIQERTGITTEMAAVATFGLSFLVAAPNNPLGAPLAIGTAVIVVAFLEAKRSLHKLLRETITEEEFNNTLRFLALIFVIYPILPHGAYGPYAFFAPRKVWLFVILVSSISYSGFFLQKFLGPARGVKFAGIFGGLASTTAATASFAKSCSEDPAHQRLYSQAAILANAIQFPRVLVILFVVNPELGRACLLPLGVMGAVGVLLGLLAGRGAEGEAAGGVSGLRNPFRLLPALKFGALFAAILFAGKVAADLLGSGGIYLTSALGGALDADAVSISAADFVSLGTMPLTAGVISVVAALLSNGVVKSVIAASEGNMAFTRRLVAAFAIMFGAGLAAWLPFLQWR